VGGISGPLLFGQFIDSGKAGVVAIGFFIGAAVMAVGGLAALVFGVHAERRSLESIATPLTAADASLATPPPAAEAQARIEAERRSGLNDRARAEEERARAAEHRAVAHDMRAALNPGGNGRVADRLRVEDVLAQIAELRAGGFDESAVVHDEQVAADQAADEAQRQAALERADAARERARAFDEHAEALAAEHRQDGQAHEALAEAAAERARAHEQRALAEQARIESGQRDGTPAELARAQVEFHDEWANVHMERALALAAEAEGDRGTASQHDRESAAHKERALAAEDRVDALRHHMAAAELETEVGAIEQAAERGHLAHERDERIRARLAQQSLRDRTGLRRFLPGPGSAFYSPGMMGTASRWAPTAEQDLDREIDVIARALDQHGATDRDELAALVGARYWGPGRFRTALRETVDEGRARRLSRTTFGPPDERAAGATG
jgi:hypothetical protein